MTYTTPAYVGTIRVTNHPIRLNASCRYPPLYANIE